MRATVALQGAVAALLPTAHVEAADTSIVRTIPNADCVILSSGKLYGVGTALARELRALRAQVQAQPQRLDLALNLARRESDLTALDPEALKALLTERGLTSFSVLTEGADDLSLRLSELDQGRKLWKWFILLALLFLAAETILIRTAR